VESLGHLLSGFAAALSWQYLLYALAGCTLGTLIGVLPGLDRQPHGDPDSAHLQPRSDRRHHSC